MNPMQARGALKAMVTGFKVAPEMMTAAGAFLLAELISSGLAAQFGANIEGSPEGKTAGSVGEQIEPPENYLSWQKEMTVQEGMRDESLAKSRGALRRFMARRTA